MKFLVGLTQNFELGNLQAAALLVCVLLTVICVVFTALVFARSKSQSFGAAGFERPVAGRIEKLDMTLNEFRTEVLRWIEFSRKELGFIKHDLQEVRNLVVERILSREPSAEGSQLAAEEGQSIPISTLAPEEVGEKKNLESESGIDTRVETVEVPTADTPLTLALRLEKTRRTLFERLRAVFAGRREIDEAALSELEALLVGCDLGARLVHGLIEEARQEFAAGRELNEENFSALLKMKLLRILEKDAPLDSSIRPERRNGKALVVMIVGVNGVGKTTTIAKLAAQWKQAGASVLVVAADTFRAAAVEQLSEWAKRVNVPLMVGTEGAKPATVVFDAMAAAKEGKYDALLIDTAGRVHTKSNLMEELQGLRNVIARHDPFAPHEVILVLDGSTGQNAVSQARKFNAAIPLTGLIVTKLDGTSKGGVVVAIKDELGVPVRYIGVGENPADLKPFVARDFVEALFKNCD